MIFRDVLQKSNFCQIYNHGIPEIILDKFRQIFFCIFPQYITSFYECIFLPNFIISFHFEELYSDVAWLKSSS